MTAAPPIADAILLGLREELEKLPGVAVGRHYPTLSPAPGDSAETYAVSVYFAPAGRNPRHLCNLGVGGGGVTLVKAGGIRARLDGDLRTFDLSDPESIPQVIAAVGEWAGLAPGKA